ncbi:MAG: TetR/AcrR family transcriptional regulator [Firmicutes bacterium]|nr:TetR/AcrR family transcriptional regulator [Bacillota bacterium]
MRNVEKDEKEMAAKRELMLEKGFRMFTEDSIESVSMHSVASACGIGPATLYRYFNTKLALVTTICARQWKDYFREVELEYAMIGGESFTAAEEFEFYLNSFISLYAKHTDMLRFNQNFNVYVRHEAGTPEQIKEVFEAIGMFRDKFHVVYEKALKDGTLKTDIPEEKIFNSTMHIMLAVCIRFASGLLVINEVDMTEELIMLKDMMMDKYVIREKRQ